MREGPDEKAMNFEQRAPATAHPPQADAAVVVI
jgi:hypothetical protein